MASAAFEKLKTLSGKWKAITSEGKNAFLTFEVVSGGTAIMERFEDEGSQRYTDMITMYHMDRGQLALKHYCGANNQPRMNLSGISPDGRTLTFDFVSATNLANPEDAHVSKALYHFHADQSFTTVWTWRKSGEDTVFEVLHFKRLNE